MADYFQPILEGNTVLFGRYPQTLVTSLSKLGQLKAMPKPNEGEFYYLDGQDYLEENGKFYAVEPIRWIILQRKGKEALLLCEPLLDVFEAHDTPATYRDSSLCDYLNGDFYENTLCRNERILDNDGLKVASIEREQIYNAFSLYGYSPSWKGKPTDYALAKGCENKDGFGLFYIASISTSETYDNYPASRYYAYYGPRKGICIRPFIRILLDEAYEEPVLEEPSKRPVSTQEELPVDLDGFVYYGKYPQTLVVDEIIIQKLSALRPGKGRPYIELDGREYAQDDGAYFSVDPIKWRIAKQEGEEAFLVSESILAIHKFDDSFGRYESSNIRVWLNTDFLNLAFQDAGSAFAESDEERIALLDLADIKNKELSFPRYIAPSDYAKSRGAKVTRQNAPYYTKSPNSDISGKEVFIVNHAPLKTGAFFSQACHYPCGVRVCAKAKVLDKPAASFVYFSNATNLNGNRYLFGQYPQSKVANPSLISSLTNIKERDEQGYIRYGGELFFQEGELFYKVEPIEWLLLRSDGEEALLLSKNTLDCEVFDPDTKKESYSYSSSAVRKYIVNVFQRRAFQDTSRLVPNEGDFVSLLSKEEAESSRFPRLVRHGWEKPLPNESRNTDYAQNKMANAYSSKEPLNYWWAKTLHEISSGQGLYSCHPDCVVDSSMSGQTIRFPAGIRPCIRVVLNGGETGRPDNPPEPKKDSIKEENRPLAEEIGPVETNTKPDPAPVPKAKPSALNPAQKEWNEEDSYPTKEEIEAALSSPSLRPDGQIAYGIYPQRKVTLQKYIDGLKGITPGPLGYLEFNGHLFHECDGKFYVVTPVCWQIQRKTEKGYVVASEMLLDVRQFNKFYKHKRPLIVGTYASNYNTSELRAWLNNEFKKMCFPTGARYLEETLLENSRISRGQVKDTKDQIFLLSIEECYAAKGKNGFRLYPSGTDYAHRKKIKVNSKGSEFYWSRSPCLRYEEFLYLTGDEEGHFYRSDLEDVAVRPAIQIVLP